MEPQLKLSNPLWGAIKKSEKIEIPPTLTLEPPILPETNRNPKENTVVASWNQSKQT